MIKHKNKIKEWLLENSDKKTSRIILYVIAFTESSFFPIPPDPFLATYILIKPNKWLKMSLFITLYSVLGGVLGYLIGYWFFDLFGPRLIDFYSFQEEFIQIEQFFSKYGFWSIFLAAFTPIPYKVFTISAGLFGANIIAFIFASVIGRGLRFLFVGFIFRYLGKNYADQVFKYFNLITLFFGLVIVAYLIYKFI
jgi:membrane protein YqaA with SNARE-associated domain